MLALQQRLLDQRRALKNLLDKARADSDTLNVRVDDGDRASFNYTNYIMFGSNQFVTKTINIAISKDADFIARRLNMFLSVRINDITNDIVDNVFRPAPYVFAVGDVGDVAFDGTFRISESIDTGGRKVSREYQNTPMPLFFAYSAPIGGNVQRGHISGLVFDEGWYFPAGSTVQINVTPILSEEASDLLTLSGLTPAEYRISAILQGFKKVRAFK